MPTSPRGEPAEPEEWRVHPYSDDMEVSSHGNVRRTSGASCKVWSDKHGYRRVIERLDAAPQPRTDRGQYAR